MPIAARTAAVPEQRSGAAPEGMKDALLEAAQAAVQAKREPQSRRAPRSGARPVVLIGGTAVAAALAVLLITQPDWLVPPPPPPEPVAVQEASARLTLVREANSVRRFRGEHGRLPATLAETGSQVRGVEYEILPGDQFALSMTYAGTSLRLQSTDRVEDFLGNSMKTVREHVR